MTIGDRAYGAMLGSLVGIRMGRPAVFLTPNQVRWYYDEIEGYTEADPELAAQQDELRPGSGIDSAEEMMIAADLLIKDRQFTADGFAAAMKAWCEKDGLLLNPELDPELRAYLETVSQGGVISPAAEAACSAGSVLRVVPVGISYYYDPDKTVEDAVRAISVSHAGRPSLAAACAVAAAVAAGFNEDFDPAAIMEYAMDAALHGEREGEDTCLPSVARRIRLAKKIVDGAKGAGMNYFIDELAGVFGNGRTAYESVPLALGLFYAAGGDPVAAVPAAAAAGGAAALHAAVCGAVCGAYTGINGFPKEWAGPARKDAGRNLKSLGMQLTRRI